MVKGNWDIIREIRFIAADERGASRLEEIDDSLELSSFHFIGSGNISQIILKDNNYKVQISVSRRCPRIYRKISNDY